MSQLSLAMISSFNWLVYEEMKQGLLQLSVKPLIIVCDQ